MQNQFFTTANETLNRNEERKLLSQSTIASWLYNNMKAHSMTLFRKWKSIKMWDFELLLTT